MNISLGDWINTPRFCKVQIDAIFADAKEAARAGYTEPTYFEDPEWAIRGKSIDRCTMFFAAIRKYPMSD